MPKGMELYMNDAVIEKIRKCLALSKSANENEAAVALKQAQALLKRHRLSERDIEFSQIKKHTMVNDIKRMRFLETRLAQMVASVFECKFLMSAKQDFIFYGIEPNLTIAEYAYNTLLPVLKKARKEYVSSLHGNTKLKTKRAMGNAFCMGWIFSVKDKCGNLHPDRQLEDLLNRYSDEVIKPRTVEINAGKVNKNKEYQAHMTGYLEGEAVGLFPGMDRKEVKHLA